MASSLSYSHNNGHCCCATATMTTNGHISPSKKRSNPRCHRRNSLPRNMDLAFRYLRPATNESTISITSIQKFLTNHFTTTDTLIMSEKLLKKLSSNGDIGDYHHCYHHPQLNQLNYLQNNHNCAINTMPIPATYKQSNIVNDAEAKLEEIINLCKTLQMNHHSPSNDGLGDGGRNYYSTIDSIVTSNNHRLSSNDECYCCTIDNIDGEDDRIQTIQSISSEHHHHFGRRPSSLSSAKVSSQSIIPPSPPKITQPLFINDLRLNHDHRRHQGDNYDVNNTPTICNTPNLVQSINKTSIVSFYDDNRRQKPVCARHLDDDQTAHEQQHHHHLQHTAHEHQQQQISSSDTPAAPSSDERIQQQPQRLIIDDDNNRPMVTKLVAKFEVNGGYSIIRQHHHHHHQQQQPHQLRRSFGNRSGHDANGSAAKIDDHRQQPTHQSTGGIQSSDDAPPSMSSSTVTFDTNYHHNDKDQDHYTPKCNTMMMIINQNVSDGNNDKQVIKCNKPKPPPKPLSLTSSMNGTSCRTSSTTLPAPPPQLSSSKIKDNPPPPPPPPQSLPAATVPPSSQLNDNPLPPPPSSTTTNGGSGSVSGGNNQGGGCGGGNYGGNHGNDCHDDDRLSIVDNTAGKLLTTNVDNVTSNRDNNHGDKLSSQLNDNHLISAPDIITMTTSATTKGVNINPTMTNTPVATSIKTTHTAMASKPSVNLRESAAELSAQSVTAESSPTNFDSRAATADRPCHGYCCYRCCCCSGGRNLVNSINSNKSHSNDQSLLGVKLSSICKCQRTTAPPSATIRTKSSNVTMHNGGATIKYHQSSITNESPSPLASSISPSAMILKDPPTIEDNIHHHSHPHQPAQQPSFNDKSLLTVNDSIILSSTASATTASSATDAEAAVTTAATDNNSSSSSSDEGIDNPAILDDDFDDDDDIDIDDIDIVDGHNRNQQRLTSPLSPKYSSNHLQPPQQAQQRHLPHSPLHHQHHFNHHSQSIINHPVTAGPDRRSSPNLRHSASKSPVVNDQAKHLEQLRREEQLLLEEIAELESEQRQQSQAISRLPSLTNGNSPVATSNDNEIDEELLEFQRIECEIKLSELRKCLQLVQKQLKNLEAPRSPMNSCNPSMDNHLTPGGHKQQLTNGHNTDDKQPSRKQSSIGQKPASAAAAAAPLAESEDDDVDGQLNSISDRGLNPDDDSDQDDGDEDLTESNDPKIVDPNLVKSLDDLLQETIETRLDKVNDLDEHEQESFVVESATAESPPLAQQGSPRSEPQQSPSGTDPAKGIIRRISQYDNDRQHDCQMKHFGYQRNFDMLMLKSVYHKLDLDKHQQMAQQSPSPSPLSSSTNPDRDRHKQPNIMSISSISNEMLLEGSTPTPTPTATDSETDSLVLLKHNPQNNLQRFTSKFPSNTTAAAAAGDEQLLSTSIPNDNLHSMKQSSVLLRNKRNSSSSNINDNSNGHQANQQNNHQRPLTLYMPVPNQKINLITHLHQLGHDLTSSIVTNHLLLTPYTCSGYLYKHCSASVGHRWRKRYFHFDRMRKVFVYYHDRSDFEKMKHPKRGVYFDEIQDVYVDHTRLNMKKFLSAPANSAAASDQSPSKSATNISSINDTQQHTRYVNSPGSMTLAARPDGHRCVFVVSTVSFSRKFILSTYTPELMRIWMDVIFTGAQAYLQDFDDQQ